MRWSPVQGRRRMERIFRASETTEGALRQEKKPASKFLPPHFLIIANNKENIFYSYGKKCGMV